MKGEIPTIKQCRYCEFVRAEYRGYAACELGRELHITVKVDDCCPRFRSAGVLPEVYVEMANVS